MSLAQLKKELRSKANKKRAKLLQGYFKTAKGEYGEGDIFLGLTVPESRKIVKKYWNTLDLKDIQSILESKIHEERFLAVSILVEKYDASNKKDKEIIKNFYLSNTKWINNWDLIDLTSPKIVGKYLYEFKEDRQILYEFAKSNDLWKKRIAILSCFWFIKYYDFKDALNIAKVLLKDKHDLIHKAVGWMLREIGKRNLKVEEDFLKRYYKQMPRTMLRYSIEKFDEKKRLAYLSGKI